MRMRNVWCLCALMTTLVAGDGGAERPAPSAPAPRIPRSPGGFGPAADGEGGSHGLLEKQGWVYLLDGRVPVADAPWDPLGLWRRRGGKDTDRSAWTIVEEGGERILRSMAGGGAGPLDLESNQGFWDFDLHIELKVEDGASGGVLLRGRYRIEIASTVAAKPSAELAPGDLGGLAGFRAPSSSASKGPGKWQTIDATLRGFLLTVRLNGEVVQDCVEIPEALRQGDRAGGDGETVNSPGPVILRTQKGTIDFRNIRVRPRPAPAIWRARASDG